MKPSIKIICETLLLDVELRILRQGCMGSLHTTSNKG